MNCLLQGIRVGLLTASASRLGGGVFEAVVAQADLLSGLGAVPVVMALEDRFGAEDATRFGPCEVYRVARRGPRQFGYAPALLEHLLATELDLLHSHGIWMYPSRAATLWARATGRPYLISPHGMLDPWITGRGRWKKSLARFGYERASWRSASAFHALTGREAADITRETGRDDCHVIGNAAPDAISEPLMSRSPRVLFISRIHPKKNLGSLLAAWRDLAGMGALPPGAVLTIAGWGEPDHVAAFEAELAGGPTSIQFVGPCFGPDKERELASARFVILPSLSEGLPMTLLEAWAAGTPTLQSSECNLPEALAAGAALDCGMDRAAIGKCLCAALTMPDYKWRAMSRAALALANGPFSRNGIGRLWANAYLGLLTGTGEGSANEAA